MNWSKHKIPFECFSVEIDMYELKIYGKLQHFRKCSFGQRQHSYRSLYAQKDLSPATM